MGDWTDREGASDLFGTGHDRIHTVPGDICSGDTDCLSVSFALWSSAKVFHQR